MKVLRYWLPLSAFAGLIFLLSSIPGNGLPMMPLAPGILPRWISENPDKIAHALMYGILGWLALRAFAGATQLPLSKAAILAFVTTALYGASDEWHQCFVPLRSCDFSDWIADIAGSLIVIGLLYPFYSKRHSKRRFH